MSAASTLQDALRLDSAHFRSLLLAAARAHSGDLCRTCGSEAMHRQFHDHSHAFFVVTLHQFSKCCYFFSQEHGFRFFVRCVALNLSFAMATCALARARSKVLQEVLMCALARARSKVSQCCSNMSRGQILEFRFLEGNYKHSSQWSPWSFSLAIIMGDLSEHVSKSATNPMVF